MNFREIARFLSVFFFILGAFLLIPLYTACYYQFFAPKVLAPQPNSTLAFVYTILICAGSGFALYRYGKKADGSKFFRREGYLSVILVWFLSGVIGGMPLYFSGTLSSPIDCYFEGISGFTTTGSTVMHPKNINLQTGLNQPIVVPLNPQIQYTFYGNINPVIDKKTGLILYSGFDAVSKGIIIWRCLMQWIGGMGIVVLFIAILPAFGLGGNKLLMQAELPGPAKENIAPRAKETASLLWKAYLSLTVIEIFLLKIFDPNLSLIDSVMISLATVSTGGFTPIRESLQIYNSASTQWILIVFMILGSVNFSLLFYVLRGKLYKLLDPELLLFLLTLLGGSFLIILTLIGSNQIIDSGSIVKFNLANSVRYSIFQYVSCQTTTGFSLVDYANWPFISQSILIVSLFIGGMSSSTSGGIKIIRYYILMRVAGHRTEAIFKPDLVKTLKVKSQIVNQATKETVLCFFFVVIGFTLIGTLFYIADKIDPKTAFSTMAGMVNNGGIGYGVAAITQTYAFMSNFSKLASTFWMILGRLEFFLILILFTPAFWRAD